MVEAIFSNNYSLQFREYSEHKLEKEFASIEACYAVISVKTYLSKEELYDALDNLNSIPKNNKVIINPTVFEPAQILPEIPQKMIFAFRGPNLETTQKYLAQYHQEKQIPPQYQPNMILVNKKYHLSKVGPAGYQERGQPFQPWGTMQFRRTSKYIGAISLMHMLTRIQKAASLGSLLFTNYDEYYRQMKMSAERRENAAKQKQQPRRSNNNRDAAD